MRIRNKPWAKEELAASKFYVQKPENNKGHWKEGFKNPENSIHLELGCGKGYFVKKAAKQNSKINYIAVDLIDTILGIANRNIIEEFKSQEIENIALTRYDVEAITNMLDKTDNIERIYINFCNPWPKPKHKKRRLTYPKQLNAYKSFLKKDGRIFFKTDDDELFEESLEYFDRCGFEIEFITRDMQSNPLPENIITEHEKMFMGEGIKIKGLIAKNDGAKPRLDKIFYKDGFVTPEGETESE